MRRALALWLLTAMVSAIMASPGRAEPLVADLTSHLIGITSGFTGTSVVLFGATDGPGDVVVVVRGPDRDMVVRRKRQVAGIWVNAKEEEFLAIPSFYSIASSRTLDAVASPSVMSLNQLGLDNLHLTMRRGAIRPEDVPFRDALIRSQQQEHLYGFGVDKVDFLGERLFRTTLNFPSNVPTGTYLVQVFLIRNKAVVAGQTTPLAIEKIGVDAQIYDLADQRSVIYGIVAVAAAMMAGWLASLPFRHA